MKLNKILYALSTTLYLATVILFIAWLGGKVSGWLWFWCFIVGYFFDEISW